MTNNASFCVLGIETSCDDTACAILHASGEASQDGGGRILASVVSSQLAAHRAYGGVVPEIASREHLKSWPLVFERTLAEAGVGLADVDLVAATKGPGLIGALLVGLSLGKALAYSLGKPFHAVHHLEGHLFSPFLNEEGGAEPTPEHFAGLVVSGGHTSIFEVDGASIRAVAEARDDAMGEVFDKVGKRLGLLYPQGPEVDELAERGNARGSPLTVARCSDGSLDFSYSGLKSQVLLRLESLVQAGLPATQSEWSNSPPEEVLDLLAGFRSAAVGQIVDRLTRLHRQDHFDLLAVSGGVAANHLLRRELQRWAEQTGVELRLVPLQLAGDNAAMIAHAALLRHQRGLSDDPLTVGAASRVPI